MSRPEAFLYMTKSYYRNTCGECGENFIVMQCQRGYDQETERETDYYVVTIPNQVSTYCPYCGTKMEKT